MVGKHRGEETIDVTGTYSKGKVSAYSRILEDFFDDGLLKRQKKWLDIGCGHGEFLLALQQLSKGKIQAKGLEPNEKKQRVAQQKGLEVSNFDLDKHNEQYDVISFLNVYSHLPDPPKIISAWKSHLKSGGELFIETGDTANLDSKDHYRPFSLPDHLSFASEEIVVGILEKNDFEIISIKKYPFILPGFFSIAKECAKIFWPNKTSRFKYLMKYKKYASTDMYIRAKLKD